MQQVEKWGHFFLENCKNLSSNSPSFWRLKPFATFYNQPLKFIVRFFFTILLNVDYWGKTKIQKNPNVNLTLVFKVVRINQQVLSSHYKEKISIFKTIVKETSFAFHSRHSFNQFIFMVCCLNSVVKSPLNVLTKLDSSNKLFPQQFNWINIRRLGQPIHVH